MEDKKYKIADLQEKSEEWKIPFSNLLAGFVLEEFMPVSYTHLTLQSRGLGDVYKRQNLCSDFPLLNLKIGFYYGMEPCWD